MSQQQNNESADATRADEEATEVLVEAASAVARLDTDEDGPDLAEGEEAPLDLALVKQVLETALLTSAEPLTLNDMKRMFPRGATNNELMRNLLGELRDAWEGRGVELVNVASGWRFRSKPELQRYLDRLYPQRAPKYSRAVMETLAIIAYRQPVTRGDIEDIRGVVVTTNVIKALEARGWIDVIGHREVPGRPAIYATTKRFLDDLNLCSLEELPPLDDLGALVEASGTSQLDMAMPMRIDGDSGESGDDGDSINVPISAGISTGISASEGLMDDFDDEAEPAAESAIKPSNDTPPPGAQLH